MFQRLTKLSWYRAFGQLALRFIQRDSPSTLHIRNLRHEPGIDAEKVIRRVHPTRQHLLDVRRRRRSDAGVFIQRQRDVTETRLQHEAFVTESRCRRRWVRARGLNARSRRQET